MSSGADFEAGVGLDVDGSPVNRAFDAIDARIAKIKTQVDDITKRAAKATDAFGGTLQMELQKVNKVLSALDSIEKTLAKPDKERMAQWDREEAAANRLAEQKRQLRAKARRDDDADARRQLADIEAQERAANKLAEEKRRLRARETRENEKTANDALRQLDREETAANRLAEEKRKLRARAAREDDAAARARLAQINLEERAANRLAEEKRRLRAQDRRDQEATARADNSVQSRFNIRTGRIDERANVAGLDLSGATARESELRSSINAQLARASVLSGEEKVQAERLLKVDEARLLVVRSRVTELQREERAAERAAATADRAAAALGKPKGPASTLGQIFNPTYAAGALGRTALYGAAGMASFAAFGAVQGAASNFVELDEKLKELQAIANATDPEMVQLSRSILEVGRSSKFSTVELAGIAAKLAQAGVSVSSMKSALTAVSTLATASGSTPDEAVDLITASLGAFQLQGKEAGRVADMMTSALNRTRLTVQQAGQAIQYVGSTAYEQNITLEQLLATTAAISQAGVKSGSTIGTGMRQFLVDLATPSKDLTEQLKNLGLTQADVDVSTRGLAAVLETLTKAGFDGAQAYKTLETRAAAWYLVAKNNLPLMDELQMAMADQGAVATANERAMNSLSAQWQRFKNIMTEEFSNSAGQILNVFKNVLEQISARMEQARKVAADPKEKSKWYNYDVTPAIESGLVNGLNWLDRVGGNGKGIQGSTPLGTYLQNLSRDSKDATGNMERLEAAVNSTTSKVGEQSDTVSALDKEILRLNTQKQDLVGHEQRVNAETVSLTARFDGLSKYIVGTTGDVGGLIGALQKLRAEQAGALVLDLEQQGSALLNRQLDAAASRKSAVGQIRGNSGLMNALGAQGRNALNLLGDNAQGRTAAQMLLDAATKFQETNADWAKLLVSAAGNRQTEYSMAGQRGLTSTRAGFADAQTSRAGQSWIEVSSTLEGQLAHLRVTKDASLKTLMENEVANAEANIKKLLASPGLKKDQVPYFQSALTELAATKRQILDAVMPTKEEQRELAKHATKGTVVHSDEMKRRLEAAFPGIHISSSGQRMPGNPAYTKGSLHTLPGGQALDITHLPTGVDPDQIIAFIEAQGVTVPNTSNGFLDEYKHPSKRATGGHLHFGWVAKASSRSERQQRDEAKAERKRQQEEDRAAREAAASEQFALGTADRVLTKSLKDLKNATTDELFQAGQDQAQAALEAWADQLKKSAQADLEKRKATPSEVLVRMQEVNDRIEQKREEVSSTIFDYFEKSIDKQLAAIALASKRRLEPFEMGAALAQGRLTGLSYQSMKGKVPDFVQQLAERRAGEAQENLARAQSSDLGARISSTEQARAYAQVQLAKGYISGSLNPGEVEKASQKIEELNHQVEDLRKQKGELDAALGASGLMPKTWGEGLRQAVDAYREANGLNRTFKEEMMMNFTGGISAANDAVTGFFNDIITGTTGVIGAFRNMAGAVMKYLQQMLVKMIAVKIMQMALNIFGGSSGPADAIGSMNVGSGPGLGGVNIPTPWFHGGQVHAFTGRYITDGVPNRDSVNAKIAKGEYVTRKSAVDSVGVGFMNDLNEHGSRALLGIQPRLIMPQPAKQEMKVFVVAPEHAPTMGPNDVLVTIANDIARGGQTKQLIKYVAQGG